MKDDVYDTDSDDDAIMFLVMNVTMMANKDENVHINSNAGTDDNDAYSNTNYEIFNDDNHNDNNNNDNNSQRK